MTFETIDAVAFGWFAVATLGYQIVTAQPWLFARSISGAVDRRRRIWMREMARRENRMMDATLLSTLSQGNAFFASTSAIAIGGLAAISGSGEKAHAFLDRLPYVAKSTPEMWELKVLLLLGIFVYSFFKFAWAFRLTHYTAIMIGAMPAFNDHALNHDHDRERHVVLTAKLNGVAAGHANHGLRAFHYAFAGLAWFFHPVLFIGVTTLVLAVLIRRDFFSRARSYIAGQ